MSSYGSIILPKAVTVLRAWSILNIGEVYDKTGDGVAMIQKTEQINRQPSLNTKLDDTDLGLTICLKTNISQYNLFSLPTHPKQKQKQPF